VSWLRTGHPRSAVAVQEIPAKRSLSMQEITLM
jgi:hypothetical protein